jgi:hypothetical protein
VRPCADAHTVANVALHTHMSSLGCAMQQSVACNTACIVQVVACRLC